MPLVALTGARPLLEQASAHPIPSRRTAAAHGATVRILSSKRPSAAGSGECIRKLMRKIAVLTALGLAAPTWAQTTSPSGDAKDTATEKKAKAKKTARKAKPGGETTSDKMKDAGDTSKEEAAKTKKKGRKAAAKAKKSAKKTTDQGKTDTTGGGTATPTEGPPK